MAEPNKYDTQKKVINMTVVEHRPPNKIVVHEIYEYRSIADLIMTRMGPDGIRPLFWCDGVLFSFYSMDGDDAKKEYIDGTKHIQIFDYIEMKDYKKSIEFEDERIRGAKVSVFDFSMYPMWKEVIKLVKSRKT